MKNKIYKLLSSVLVIAIALSYCVIGFTAKAEESSSTLKATYYLSNNTGTGSGDGTQLKPFKTIEEALNYAVSKADEGGYNSVENLVEFKLLDAYDSDEDIVSWGNLESLIHAFTLKISSNSSKACFGYTTDLGRHGYVCGPTILENVIVNQSGYAYILLNNDLTLGDNVSFQGNKNSYFSIGKYANANLINSFKEHIIVYNTQDTTAWSRMHIGSRYGAAYYSDVNFVYDSPNNTQTIYLGPSTTSDTRKSTFYAGLNFDFRASKGITLAESAGGAEFGSESTFQLIDSTGGKVDYSAIESKLPTNSWIITNNTGIKDLLTFTATAGEYTFDNSKYAVVATPKAGGEAIKSTTGTLKLEAPGEYTIELDASPVDKVFYIDAATTVADGERNGISKATPCKTIGEALAIAIQDANNRNYNVPASNITFEILSTTPVVYSDVTDQSYNFKLKITSNISGAVLENVGDNISTRFCGPVEFENVKIVITQSYNKGNLIYLFGNDFIVGENAYIHLESPNYPQSYFVTASNTTGFTVSSPQYIKFVNRSTGYIQYFGVGNKNTTYAEDLTFVFDIDGTQNIRLDGASSSSYTLYEKNLNFDFRNGKFNFSLRNPNNSSYGAQFDEDAAVQIINSTGNDIGYVGANGSNDTISTFEAFFERDLPTDRTYILNNTSVIKDALTFTEKAGTYAVDSSKYIITATPVDVSGNATGSGIDSEDNKLVLTPGRYDLTCEVISGESKEYLVDAVSGVDDNDSSTAFKTLGGALNIALQEAVVGGYNHSKSLVTLKIVGENPVQLKTINDIEYAFKLRLTSNTSGAVLDNGIYDAQTNPDANVRLGGSLMLENITLKLRHYTYEYPYYVTDNIYLGGNDFEIGENVTIVQPTQDDANPTANYSNLQTILCFGAVGAKNINKDQTIKYFDNGKKGFTYFELGGGGSGANTYNKDVNLIYSAPNYGQTIRFDTVSSSATIKYNKNVNLDLRDGKVTLSGRPTGQCFSFAANKASAVQIINSTGSDITYSGGLQEVLFGESAWANTYVLNNLTDIKDLFTFTATAGTYDVNPEHLNIMAIDENKVTYEVVDGQLKLPKAGTYEIVLEPEIEYPQNNYADYINYLGDGLKNTCLKLSKGEDINVAYFGGSVTGGSGVDTPDTDSWRALVGNWFKTQFPASDINNINLAYGETGTLFGVYRTEVELLAAKPDLVFIDFAINDLYDYNTSVVNGNTESIEDAVAKAKGRFETIVRKIRMANPECDIVTLLITDKNNQNSDPEQLFSFAQAHKEIADAYQIPTINMGGAIIDYLEKSGEAWNLYFFDSVHPIEKGYEFYFGVIKEYLNNELWHGGYSGSVVRHTLPAQTVSPNYIEGSYTVFDVDSALITKSESLGGSGYTYGNATVFRNVFYGGAQANPAENGSYEDDLFAIKFTGTELAVLHHNKNVSGYEVSIDGGAFNTVNRITGRVSVLATGLSNTEHTVKFRPVGTSQVNTNGEQAWIMAFFAYNPVADSTDLNGVDGYNICDLVRVAELEGKAYTDSDYSRPVDKNKDGVIDAEDIAIVLKELLTGEHHETGADVATLSITPVDVTDET